MLRPSERFGNLSPVSPLGTRSLALFCSAAALQTHHADSDADVAVLLQGQRQRFVSTKLAMADVAFDVLLETGISISPLPVWLDEWDNPDAYPNPQLLQNIAREGVRL